MITERFMPPAAGEQTLRRPLLLSKMIKRAHRTILYVHGPPGAGKTTAVAEWTRTRDYGTAWFTIDSYSASPHDFCSGLLQALTGRQPELDAHRTPVPDMLHRLETLSGFPDCLVLDNFHLCPEESLGQVLPEIRRRLPPTTAMVVISRTPPCGALAGEVAKGQIRCVDARDLAFQPQEIKLLFRQEGVSLTDAAAEAVLEKTGGWAAAVAAMCFAAREGYSWGDLLSTDHLSAFFRDFMFSDPRDLDLMVRCAVCDVLTPSLCRALTGDDGTWAVLQRLHRETGLIVRLSGGAMRMHDLLKDFLTPELEGLPVSERERLHSVVARWHLENGDRVSGLAHAAKSGDLPLIEQALRACTDGYGQGRPDIDRYLQAADVDRLCAIPDRVVAASPRIAITCAYTTFLTGRLEQATAYMDLLRDHWAGEGAGEGDKLAMALVLSCDPRRDSWYLTEVLDGMESPPPGGGEGGPASFSMTQNFPFFHKAQLDYTDISPRHDDYFREIEPVMSRALGRVNEPLRLLCIAGVLYERGELAEAQAVARQTLDPGLQLTPEITFSSYMLNVEIARCLGRDVSGLLMRASALLAGQDAGYLEANFQAVETTVALYGGDVEAATDWLDHSALPEGGLPLYRIEQYFTQARAYIVIGEYRLAEGLLERILQLAEGYHRPCHTAEALTLLAVCHSGLRDTARADAALTRALETACTYAITMPIVKEGNAVTPLLERLVQCEKRGYSHGLDRAFINRVLLEATRLGRRIPGLTAGRREASVSLSARQREILALILEGCTQQEMADRLGVKLCTINEHVGKLYSKLGVNNATDALLTARQLHLLEA